MKKNHIKDASLTKTYTKSSSIHKNVQVIVIKQLDLYKMLVLILLEKYLCNTFLLPVFSFHKSFL